MYDIANTIKELTTLSFEIDLGSDKMLNWINLTFGKSFYYVEINDLLMVKIIKH